VFVLGFPGLPAHGDRPMIDEPIADEPVTVNQLESARKEADIPALGVLVATGSGKSQMQVSGYRKAGADEAVNRNDPWHLGSNTKAMTALLVGRLAEQGRIDFNETVGDRLSEHVDKLHPDWKPVSYRELLTHCSGLPANPSQLTALRLSGAGRDEVADRLRASSRLLAKAPQTSPGSTFEYSNAGYVVVGAMLEAATGVSWNTLMSEEIFKPLGLDSAGFGAPGSPDRVDAPRGHRKGLLGGIKSVEPGPLADNPPFMAPAGRVYMNLDDYARFLGEYLAGLRGEGKLLSREGYAGLIEPGCGGDYAAGWGLGEDGSLVHEGSNTLWYARAVVWPEDDLAIAVVSNDGRLQAQEAVFNELIETLQRAGVNARAPGDRDRASR